MPRPKRTPPDSPAKPLPGPAEAPPPTKPLASPPPTPLAPSADPHLMTNQQEIRACAGKDPAVLRAIHGQGYSGLILRSMYESFAGKGVFAVTAQEFQVDSLRQMEARDPLEQMLIDQMLWTHVRIGRLSMLATQQTGLKQVQVIHEATDRALNAFRRQVLALQEYRTPKPAPTFTAIKQQNIALVNATKPQESQIKKVTNEKEDDHAPPSIPAPPADTHPPGVSAGEHSTRPTVEMGNRAENGGG